MGGSIGTPVAPTTPATTPATTSATPQLVNRGAGMSTLPVSPTGPTGLPSTSNKGGGSPTVPAAAPPPPPQMSSLIRGYGTPPLSTSNKGGGSATLPSPTFASDPVVAQPLPTPIQSNKGGGVSSPLTPTPTSPYTGLASIPLSPYGSTGYTSPGPQIDVTELSKTSFDPELTARDTLRRLDAIDKRFAEQDAAAANAPTAEQIEAEQDRIFAESQRRYWEDQSMF
jgi:hypothetical protein